MASRQPCSRADSPVPWRLPCASCRLRSNRASASRIFSSGISLGRDVQVGDAEFDGLFHVHAADASALANPGLLHAMKQIGAAASDVELTHEGLTFCIPGAAQPGAALDAARQSPPPSPSSALPPAPTFRDAIARAWSASQTRGRLMIRHIGELIAKKRSTGASAPWRSIGLGLAPRVPFALPRELSLDDAGVDEALVAGAALPSAAARLLSAADPAGRRLRENLVAACDSPGAWRTSMAVSDSMVHGYIAWDELGSAAAGAPRYRDAAGPPAHTVDGAMGGPRIG